MEILENEPMSRHTSFKVGGPAKFFAKVENTSELVEVYRKAQESGLPSFLLGKGTNLLVSDKGFDGYIIQLGKSFSEIEILEGGKIRAGAATPLARLARTSITQGLEGMHKLAGIPGSLGGAIYMNAGAYGQEIGNTCVEVVSADSAGALHTRTAAECKFSYRHSLFQELNAMPPSVAEKCAGSCKNHAEVVLSATFQLMPAASLGKTTAQAVPRTAADLEREMQECMEKRRKSQPLSMPNAGSTFKRLAAGAADTPTQIAPGYYIEQAGLKGYRIGGAEVSQVHANFIVNAGNATASDIKTLSEFVQNAVFEKFGIKLQREIILLGKF
ncbi:MAG: UDP-N-acetylmuramate dehydrogenase [Fibrobacter sp.]|nr:UDP-N-acetylmuramate dehydrogenase [Fibrobacter sp.]